MINLKALALTALTALTLTAPVQARQGDMTPVENCLDIYRQATPQTECYQQGVGYRTVEQYVAQVEANRGWRNRPAPTVTYQRPTYAQFERKCNIYSNSYIKKSTYGNTLECISNGSSIAVWSPTGYGF